MELFMYDIEITDLSYAIDGIAIIAASEEEALKQASEILGTEDLVVYSCVPVTAGACVRYSYYE